MYLYLTNIFSNWIYVLGLDSLDVKGHCTLTHCVITLFVCLDRVLSCRLVTSTIVAIPNHASRRCGPIGPSPRSASPACRPPSTMPGGLGLRLRLSRALQPCGAARMFSSASALKAAQLRGAPVDVHPEVQDALHSGKPVVALESTIITHGMPFPTNLSTARSVETIVRSTGAIPATIGLIGGRVKIGLQPVELERLADVQNNPGAVKLSRRDIGPAIATGRDGGTTCSSTLIFAAMAGIKVCSHAASGNF